jgi:hypothetical protein
MIQEAALQFPEGRKQPNPAADHLSEGIKDSPPAAAVGPSEKNHRAGDAGRQRAVIVAILYHLHLYVLFIPIKYSHCHNTSY